jgi:DNA polymerase III subunit epsilon
VRFLAGLFAARMHAGQQPARVIVPARGTPLGEVRWVILDTETSGLDARRDRVLSVGACAIEAGSVRLAGSFEALLRQEQPTDVHNVLVHGIGYQAQTSGAPAGEALATFLQFAQADVAVGYHTLFDLVVLNRAIRKQLGVRYQPWYVDLALLLPAVTGREDAHGWELDQWLEHYGIEVYARHQALADAFATAQLFLLVLERVQRQGLRTLGELLRLHARELAALEARG